MKIERAIIAPVICLANRLSGLKEGILKYPRARAPGNFLMTLSELDDVRVCEMRGITTCTSGNSVLLGDTRGPDYVSFGEESQNAITCLQPSALSLIYSDVEDLDIRMIRYTVNLST